MAPTPIETVEIPRWLEMVAVVAGALAGSAYAIKEHLAVSGVVALAVTGGLGGGIIRDLLLQAGTPVAFTDPWLLVVAVLSSLPALLLSPVVRGLKWPMLTVGALSLGMYSVLGADKSLLLGLPPVGSILIGVLAGTGGSVLADIAVGVPPALFRPGMLLGSASALGTVVFVAGAYWTDSRAAWFIAGVIVITATRMVSLVTGLHDAPADVLATSSERALKKIPIQKLPLPTSPGWMRRRRRSGGQDP